MYKSSYLKDKRLHYKYPEILSSNKRIYCDPTGGVLTTVGIVAMAAAPGGVSAYGQYQAGQSQDKYYKALADQNDREAVMAKETADQQITILQNEAAQRSKELAGDVRVVKGSQKAAMATLGIYGVTADDIIGDTTNKAKLDEANIRYNADVGSWAIKKEAADKGWVLNSQSNLFRMAGKQAKTASYINMTTTLLGTAASITGGLRGLKLKPTGTSKIYTGNDFGGFTPSDKLKGFNWSPSKIY